MKKALFSLLFLASAAHSQALLPFVQNGKYGFKKSGSEIIPAKFDYACDFTSNLALVKVSGLWGFIDTLGNMKIPAIYQKAEPFKSEITFVKLNNKVGLIDTAGNYLVKPDYDEILQRTPSEFYLNNKAGKGLYYAYKNLTIPAIYKDIQIYGLHINAKKENGKWDLYRQAKLIAEDVDRTVKYSDHENGDLLRVQKNNRVGMYKSDQKWVFEPVYVLIDKIPFPEYTADGMRFNYIYALYSMENKTADYIDQFETPALIQFAKGDGTFISEKQVANFESFVIDPAIACKVCIQAQGEAGNFFIDYRAKVDEMNYDWLFPQMEWYFAARKDQYFILDNNLQPIDSFKEVSRYDETIYDYGDNVLNPDGEYDVKIVPVDNEPFLIVSQQVGDSMQKALYSLVERKVISPWFPYEMELNVGRAWLGNETLYTFQGNHGKIGFYTYGMKSPSSVMYDSYEILLNHVLKVKTPDGLEAAFGLKDDVFVQLCEEELIAEADKPVYVQENSEEIGDVEIQFGYDFLFTRGKEGKYGLISRNNVVIDPVFDTIIQNRSNPYFVSTVKNGKYGTVEISTGDQILPFSDVPLEFVYADGTERPYAKIGEGAGSYYLTAKGQKFYTVNPEAVVFKEKGLYGLKSYSDFDGEKLYVLVKPAYKSMKRLLYENTFIVKGSNKKYGAINQYGDTVVAFRYDRLEEYGYDNYQQLGLLLKTTVKGKRGIVSTSSGEIVMPEFDEIVDFQLNGYISGVYEVKKNKKTGVYAAGAGVVLPCSFDYVSSRWLNGFYAFIGEKEDKLYVQSISFRGNDGEKQGDLSRAYDLISGDAGFVILGDQFLKYGLRTGQFQDTVSTTDVSYSNSHFTLVSRNGKWGALDFYGNEIVPFIYDSGQFLDYREEVMIGFENGIKYYIYVDNNQRYTENEW